MAVNRTIRLRTKLMMVGGTMVVAVAVLAIQASTHSVSDEAILQMARAQMQKHTASAGLHNIDCMLTPPHPQDMRDVTCSLYQGATLASRTTFLFGTKGCLYGFQDWTD